MWSYLGSKSKITRLYPPPKHGVIIEPFAGSARYSLLHFENDVYLYDVNPLIIDLWHYLIAASPADILGLPDVPSKVSLDTFTQLADIERALIGFHLCRGKARPRKMGHGQNSWNADKRRIAAELHKIKHWHVELRSFETIPNSKATHFIDPPYKATQERPGNSDRYPHGDGLDYGKLAEFVLSRQGLVIACEGVGADYLPFGLLKMVNTNTNNKTVGKTAEMVFICEN